MLYIRQFQARTSEDDVLRAMFAARKAVFVDLLKWDVPVIDGVYEVDQFDNSHATYLVLANEEGAHLASARLLPTTWPHLLGDLFPGLCEAPPPRRPDIFETTRFCLDRRLTARMRRQVRDTLVVAIAEHALANGITAYTAIAEMAWVQQILSFGWRCAPLGLPSRVGGTLLTALRIEIEADTPERLATAGLVAGPALVRHTQRLAA